MKIYKCTESQPNWFITDRKPTICPHCKTKEVRKAVLGKPTEEDYFRDDLFLMGKICPRLKWTDSGQITIQIYS